MTKLWPLFLAALVGWCLFGAWYLAGNRCNPVLSTTTTKAVTAPIAPKASTAFSIADRNAFNTKSTQHFTFPKASNTPTIPAKAKASFQELATYLKKNPNRQAMLTGYYQGDEKNSTSFQNLGIARADAIKQKLIAWGAPATCLITKGQQRNGLDFKNTLLHNGVNFAFRNTPDARLLEPLNVYFQSGSNTIIENDDLRTYFQKLQKYTADNPNAKVNITGHTDSQGNAQANVQLGARRADFIRDYLVGKGFKKSMFATSSKGSAVPLQTNDTPEGRAKNRRVEVRLGN